MRTLASATLVAAFAAAALAAATLPACVDAAADDGDVTVTDEVGAPAPDGKADANDLSTAQAKAARTQLDNICGDTWCDGDFIYSFKKVVCHFSKSSCTVTMMITAPYYGKTPIPTYWRSCKIGGLHRFEDLVDTTNGYQSIDQDFYGKMTTCIMKVEAKLPHA